MARMKLNLGGSSAVDDDEPRANCGRLKAHNHGALAGRRVATRRDPFGDAVTAEAFLDVMSPAKTSLRHRKSGARTERCTRVER
jgi:hypothetical protein